MHRWSLVAGPSDLSIPPASLASQYFFLPRRSFSAGALYRFELTIAVAADPARFTTTTLTVRVRAAALVATIAGGDRLHFAGAPLLLDASASHDPMTLLDSASLAPTFGHDNGVAIAWECRLQATGQLCFGPAAHASFVNTTTYFIPTSALSAVLAGKHTLQIEIELRKEERVSRFAVVVQLSDEPVLPVAITPLLGVLSAHNMLRMEGGVLLASSSSSSSSSRTEDPYAVSSSYQYSWTLVSGPLDLLDPSVRGTSLQTRYLAIRPEALQAGASYTFELRVTDPAAVVGQARMGAARSTLRMNAAPSHGRCGGAPATGIALNSEFVVRCMGWEDDVEHLPLAYEFQLLKKGVAVSMGIAGGSNEVACVLPEGNHTIVASIRDRHGAVAQVQVQLEAKAVGACAETLRSLPAATITATATAPIKHTHAHAHASTHARTHTHTCTRVLTTHTTHTPHTHHTKINTNTTQNYKKLEDNQKDPPLPLPLPQPWQRTR